MNTDQDEYKGENRKSGLTLIIIIIILIILLLGLVISVYLIRKQTSITGRAYSNISPGQIELANSYLFASPLKAKADGLERIRITIFILDSQGKGMKGKEVIFGSLPQITLDAIQNQTDDVGRAIFDVTSKVPGLYIMEASVDGKTLPQRVNITFE